MPYEVELNYLREVSHKDSGNTVWWKHLLAGGIAGAFSRTLTAPLDRVKIFFQIQYVKNYSWNQTLRDMLLEGGILSFWRGNAVSVLKVAPETASKFLAYEEAKQRFVQENARQLTISDRFLAGAFAGCVSQSVIYPFDVLKTKMALKRTEEVERTIKLAKDYYKKYGIAFFFRGYWCNIIGVVLFAGLDLTLYETLKGHYLLRQYGENHEHHPPISVLLSCGLVSSLVSQTTTYPFAFLTTAMQNDEGILEYKLFTRYKRVLETTWREGGGGAFFRGITPTLIKGVPTICISYIVYEFILVRLGAEMT